jgi:hypothetical protein
MAPIITAVEFIFNPMEAIIMEKIRIQAAGPRKLISRFIPAMVESISVPSVILNIDRRNLRKAINKWRISFSCLILSFDYLVRKIEKKGIYDCSSVKLKNGFQQDWQRAIASGFPICF